MTRDRMYLETMQEVFSNVSKVMVDSKANNNLLFLPLDKILQQTSQASQAAVTSAEGTMGSPASAPTPAAEPARALPQPSLRDRLREGR